MRFFTKYFALAYATIGYYVLNKTCPIKANHFQFKVRRLDLIWCMFNLNDTYIEK